jgi:nucleoside-diphosphate-sugar epimerase
MKILITGSNGMVGKNILQNKNKKFKFISPSKKELNLYNFKKLKKYLISEKPDLIIHAAGDVRGILYNKNNNFSSLINNSEMGKNIVLAAYESKIKYIFNISSSSIYPVEAKTPFRENQILTGKLDGTNEGYALSKIFAQKLCDYITENNSDFYYKTIIPCNLYGKFDNFDKFKGQMIPSVISKLHDAKITKQKTVYIWGSGKSKREFMYAKDFSRFMNFAILNFSKIPQTINIGTGKEYSINYYYKIISEILGYKCQYKNDLKYPEGVKSKIVNIEKQKKLKWSPIYSLEKGIKETYRYYLSTVKYKK